MLAYGVSVGAPQFGPLCEAAPAWCTCALAGSVLAALGAYSDAAGVAAWEHQTPLDRG